MRPSFSGKVFSLMALVLASGQVGKVFHSYVEGTNLKVVMLIGQKSLAAEQASLLEQR